MVIAIEKGSWSDTRHFLDQMYGLRAKVFDERLGWQVAARDGRAVSTMLPASCLPASSNGAFRADTPRWSRSPTLPSSASSDVLGGYFVGSDHHKG